MFPRWIGLEVLLTAVWLAGTGFGIATPAAAEDNFPPQVDATGRTEILNWVCETLNARYVDPDLAGIIVDKIRAKAAAGAYSGLDDAGAYLQALEQDLRTASNDKHMRLWPERLEDLKKDDVDFTPADTAYVVRLRRSNYGFRKIEILPNNVGYLRIDEFAHPALGGPTAIAVMNAVGSVDALIIDLRWNGGGAGLVNLISGYFFGESTRLNDVWERASGETAQGWTPEYLPGPSLSHVPLFILISGRTFSAAEDFAYGLKHAGRATIVGERSKGGGHPVEFVRMVRRDMAVAMMVANAKSINHVTGTSWEAVGVAPDLEVPARQALEAGYKAATDTLLAHADGDEAKHRIEWERTGFEAILHPMEITRAQLAAYAGEYEGRSFSIGAGDILLYMSDEATYPLIPMGKDLFGFEDYGELRFRFERDGRGRVDRVASLTPDGQSKVRRKSR